MSQTHLPQNWIQKVMVLLSIPGWISGHYYHQIVRFFEAWAQAEGGTAEWDPLNTTDHISDAWGPWYIKDYNSTGVVNYESPWKGIVGTAATLLESTVFQAIVQDLRTAEGNKLTAEQLVNRHKDAIHTWGTNPDLMLQILKTTP